jgi:flagellar biosynthesis protein FlhG
MFDQAEALREIIRGRFQSVGNTNAARVPYVVAVTSGKGGVGKTSIAVNMALMLAKSGRRVAMLDADFGLANAEVLMGISPRYTLRDVMEGKVDLDGAWEESVSGIRLLSSGSGVVEMANLARHDANTVIEQVIRSASGSDILVVDTAPGIDESVTCILRAADEVMVVTTPEPTSITDCYAALKVLFANDLDAHTTLVVNNCPNPAQATLVAQNLDSICARFLSQSFQRHEYLPSDSAVGVAVRKQKPFALHAGHSPIATWLKKAAIKLDERARRCSERAPAIEGVAA